MEFVFRQGNLGDALKVAARIPEFATPYPRAEYEKRLRLSPKQLILVAYYQHEPVGFKIGYQRYTDGSFYSWMGGVLPAYRQKGVASQLAQLMETWAIQQGYTSIIFKTRNKFKTMLIFGLKHGFQVIAFEKKEPVEESRIILQKKITFF